MKLIIIGLFEITLYILLFMCAGYYLLHLIAKAMRRSRKIAQLKAGAPVSFQSNGKTIYGFSRGFADNGEVKVKAGKYGFLYYIPLKDITINL